MKNILLIMAVLVLLGGKADAFLVNPPVSTCASKDGERWLGQQGSGCGTSFFQGDAVAYQFRVDFPVYVSSIEAWVAYNNVDQNNMAGANIVIYDQTGGNEHTGQIPTGYRVFEKYFAFTVDPNQSSPAEWRGINDVAIDFQPGRDYWVAFEDGTRGTFVSGKEGFRMEAVHNPEPATMFLMGGGLLAMLRRRRDDRVRS